jgi:hypothetical protein
VAEENESEPAETPAPATPAKPRPPKAPPGLLQRETDIAVRPGFRSPANSRSKAQKKKK